jgi:hypothetical protein
MVAPTALQFLLEPLIAAVEVVDAVDFGLALGARPARTRLIEARRSVAMTGAPVSPSTPWTIAERPRTSMLGAHAAQLGDVHVAVLEDRFLEVAFARRAAQHGHELRLHVGREAGVGRGRDGERLERPSAVTLIPSGEFDHQPGAARALVIASMSDARAPTSSIEPPVIPAAQA